jgi:hypothetical protein
VHATGGDHSWCVLNDEPPHNSELSYAALESSHAIWEGVRLAKTLPKESDIVIVRRASSSALLSLLLFDLPVSFWQRRQGRGADI